jgi:hypothetical protein
MIPHLRLPNRILPNRILPNRILPNRIPHTGLTGGDALCLLRAGESVRGQREVFMYIMYVLKPPLSLAYVQHSM